MVLTYRKQSVREMNVMIKMNSEGKGPFLKLENSSHYKMKCGKTYIEHILHMLVIQT